MPIRLENKHRYPANWQEIRARILHRAGNRCEQCRVINRAWGWRDDGGNFHSVRKGPLIEAAYRRPPFELGTREGRMLRIIEIVLTIAHLDHIPEHCDDYNLRALCQRCHLRYDRQHHAETRRAIPGQREMFS